MMTADFEKIKSLVLHQMMSNRTLFSMNNKNIKNRKVTDRTAQVKFSQIVQIPAWVTKKSWIFSLARLVLKKAIPIDR